MSGSGAAGQDGVDDDEVLVGRARGGDRQAFGLLVRRHYALIHRAAFRWSGRAADAEDIAQEACIRLAKAIAGFQGECRFTTWLYRLVLSSAQDWSRARSRQEGRWQALDGVAEPADTREDPERRVLARELVQAVAGLPEGQREAASLVWGEGLTQAEAAEVLEVAEGTVAWRLHAARKALTGRLGSLVLET